MVIDWPRVLVLGGGLVVVALILLASKRRRRREMASNQRKVSLAQERSIDRDMQALMRELSDMVRRAGGQFDDRANRLEQLIHGADARIKQLQSMQQDVPAKPSQPRLVEDHSGESPENRSAAAALESADAPDSRHADIYELHAQGLTPHQIADHLNRPRGEIELIIALRPRGREAI